MQIRLFVWGQHQRCRRWGDLLDDFFEECEHFAGFGVTSLDRFLRENQLVIDFNFEGATCPCDEYEFVDDVLVAF